MSPGKKMFAIVAGTIVAAVVAGIVFFTGFVEPALHSYLVNGLLSDHISDRAS